jgi:hypothetical protein
MKTWEQNGGRIAFDVDRENEGEEREAGEVA